MKKIIKEIIKALMLFGIGGMTYVFIELIYRGYSHPSMFFVGGLAFILIGNLNEGYSWDMPLIKQMLHSAIIVTIVEFISGLVLNVFLGLNVWDYSNLPFNIMGQICLPFTIIWFLLSFVAILYDDDIRWLLFDEEKPRYKLF